MPREIVWQHSNEIGIEHLTLRFSDDGSQEAASTVVNVIDGRPFTLSYRIEAEGWITRRLMVEMPRGDARIDLRSDGDGRWFMGDDSQSDLEGCIDVDIMATPFTNALPIGRLQLQPGESRDLDVVYVAVPSLEVSRSSQRYTCLSDRGEYRYQSLRAGEVAFSVDIAVDEDGLVIDYPGFFRRIALAQDEGG